MQLNLKHKLTKGDMEGIASKMTYLVILNDLSKAMTRFSGDPLSNIKEFSVVPSLRMKIISRGLAFGGTIKELISVSSILIGRKNSLEELSGLISTLSVFKKQNKCPEVHLMLPKGTR